MNNNQLDKFSKAQIEVWEMKASIYEKVKNLPIKQALMSILMQSKLTTENLIKEGKINELKKYDKIIKKEILKTEKEYRRYNGC